MSRTSALSLLLSIIFVQSVLFAQTPPTSDPLAVSLAQQSIALLTGSAPVTDVTLNANVVSIVGPDSATVTATLQAKGTSESRIDLNLPGGTSTDIRNDSTGYPQGASVVGSGTQQTWPTHNCWINASWFFPALSVLAATSDPSVVLSYLGQEARNGATVRHLQSFRYAPAKKPSITALNQSLSTMDIYLDAASLLPVAMIFNTHPHDDALTNILIEVDFSNYQVVSGVQVPFHIQKFLDGGLALDVVVGSAVFNTNPPDSLFAIQ